MIQSVSPLQSVGSSLTDSLSSSPSVRQSVYRRRTTTTDYYGHSTEWVNPSQSVARPTETSGQREVLKPASDEQNAAYRNGQCIDCRSTRYSPGRPRCNDCHHTYLTTRTGYAL